MHLGIIPLGTVPATVIDEVEAVAQDRFAARTRVESPLELPRAAYHRHRNQYDAEQLVQRVTAAGETEKNLAITPADLFVDNRDFIFGLALFEGDSGIVGLDRLKKTTTGEAVDAETATQRIRTEAVHEIGHLVGHRHCKNSFCAMSFSSTVPQIDQKHDRLCRSCRK